MHTLSLNYVNTIIKGTIYGGGSKNLDNIFVDSRKLIDGTVFWTIGGERTHGAKFLKEAFGKGIIGAIIPYEYKDVYINDLKDYHHNTWILCVEDTLVALHTLAESWRRNFTIPIIGITGTVGKTTTKNMVGAFFKELEGHSPLITERSENGLIGLPLTILKLRNYHTIAILEMGISTCGEMEKLSYIAKPTISIITFLGNAHLQGYSSKKEILVQEKLRIIKYALDYDNNKKMLIINGDGIEGVPRGLNYEKNNIIMYGEKKSDFYSWRGCLDDTDKNFIIQNENNIICEFIPDIRHKGFLMATIPLAIITNLLAINWSYFKDFCKYYMPEGEGRFQIIPIQKTNAVVINDAYNANPDSFNVSLDALNSMYEQREKILIIGDMRELGENAFMFHQIVVEKIKTIKNIMKIIVCGEMFFNILCNIDQLKNILVYCNSHQEIISEAKKSFNENSIIFIKASNGFELYKLPKIILAMFDE